MTQPHITIPTKHGDMTLYFVDWPAEQRDRPPIVARAEGVLTLNGVACQIDARLAYITHRHDRGSILDEAVVKFERAYWSWDSCRRVEGGQLTSNMYAKFDELCDLILRSVYEAHPELQHAAKRETLADQVKRASEEVGRLDKVHSAAVAELVKASDALYLFDHPVTEFQEVPT